MWRLIAQQLNDLYTYRTYIYKESWVLKNWCFWTVLLEKTLESPLDCKEIQPVHPKGDQSWYLLEGLMLELKFQYLATSCEELTHWKRLWCWEGLREGGEGDDRGWDGWMASPTRWTWVWVNSGSWWWTGRPGVLQFMGLQKVRHDWVTEPNWTQLLSSKSMIWLLKLLQIVFPVEVKELPLGRELALWYSYEMTEE